MGGFHLDGVSGRVPCPHCANTDGSPSTDCAGIRWDGPEDSKGWGNARLTATLICARTGEDVTEEMLMEQASLAGMLRKGEA